MFYSETLLAKTGPLARVWLASNVERKLTKSQILASDIQSSVGAIVDTGQAPMALRLSGQLMLGVVRIYGRKARYLLDDCNDTLMKIRMTFKSTTNHDLLQTTSTAAELNLPELLTVDDLFPSLELPFPMSQIPNADPNKTSQDLGIDWTSTLNPQTNTQSRLSPDDQPLLNDEELELDFGEDVGLPGNETTISMEMGRNAPAQRPVAQDLFSDNPMLVGEDLALDFGEDVPMADRPLSNEQITDGREMITDLEPHLDDDETLQLRNTADGARQHRDSEPPLFDAASGVILDLDRTYIDEREISEVAVQQPQRSKKRRPIVPDAETILHNRQIKAQSEDRSKILRPMVFLPRNPLLLHLMNLQKQGDFVSSIMNDTRSHNMAPELQGLLSIDAFRRSGDLKRKRDSGIADISDDEHGEKSPRLELPEDGENDYQADEGIDFADSSAIRPSIFEIPGETDVQPITGDGGMVHSGNEDGIFAEGDAFDETTMPLVHPADSGPISVSTKRAVQLLREQFGQEIDGSPASQARKSVLLQDLVPEGKSSKEDATKMFFEVLVLATKDAIKVDQSDKSIGLPLRIRGKRGLWGSWAEVNPTEPSSPVRTRVAPIAV